MSYTISEGIEDAKRRLAAEQAIAKRYPDATMDGLPDGRRVWMADAVSEEAIGVDFVTGKVDVGDGKVYLWPFVEVEEMRVYARYSIRWGQYGAWHRIEKMPDLYKAIVAAVTAK